MSDNTPLNSPELLFQDLQRYRKRRKFLEKTIFTLSRELDQVAKIETALKQAYDINREGDKELRNFGKVRKQQARTFELVCVECGSDFQASWRGRKNCQDCLEKNPVAKAAQTTRLRAINNRG